MFNLTKFSDLLNNLDNAAKETLEEPKESATSLRLLKQKSSSSSVSSTEDHAQTSFDQVSNLSSKNENNRNEATTSSHIGSDITYANSSDSSMSISGTPNGNFSGSTPISTGSITNSLKNITSLEDSSELNRTTNITDGENRSNSAANAINNSSKGFDQTNNLRSSNHNPLQQQSNLPLQQQQQQQQQDVKQLLKIKNKEIEKLNSEILELEETCQSMKQEVQEAWNSYKTSQDKAMLRESELQEEIRLLQKAKYADKQQIQIQLTQMNTDVADLLKKLKLIETERDEWQEKYKQIEELQKNWIFQEKEYLVQIDELKMGTQQGVTLLREELKKEKSINDELRSERVLNFRQNELRLFELETSNNENMKALTDKDYELNQYKALLNQTGGIKDYQSLTHDYDILKQDYHSSIQQIELQKDAILQYDKRIRQYESELKLSQIKAEDDKIRVNELMSISDAKIIELQNALQQQQHSNNNNHENNNINVSDNNNNNSNNNSDNNNNNSNNNTNTKMNLLMEQIQSLSKQLMKKQEMTTELQTEKSVLKSRVMDLMARCTYAEQELSRLRDIEDGNDDDDDDDDGNANNNHNNYNIVDNNGRGLVHRNANNATTITNESATNTPLKTTTSSFSTDNQDFTYSNGKYHHINKSTNSKGNKGKIMTDLALLGVKASPSVVKAMNVIDSFTLVTGRILRTHSILRIFFLFYLLILHLWVIFILGVHVHSIDIQSINSPV